MRDNDEKLLPNAPACERNREPILAAMLPHLLTAIDARRAAQDAAVGASGELRCECFEVGSGTGQHAAWFTRYFASAAAEPALQQLFWQPSDLQANLPAIERWREHGGVAQMLPAIPLDLRKPAWPAAQYDFFYTANTLHIVSWPLVEALCEGLVSTLRAGGIAFIYGPFNYHGAYTSESNHRFDDSLRARDPQSGIRDFAAVVDTLRRAAHDHSMLLDLLEDKPMPANNRLLVLQVRARNQAAGN